MMKIYILATGPSINDITKKEWQYLKTQITMGVSWFAKHPFFQPTYHYFHEYNQRTKMLQWIEKWNKTVFITTEQHLIPDQAKKEGRYIYIKHTPFKEAFHGKTWKIGEPPPEPFESVWAKSFDEYLFGFRGSLIAAVNAASVLGATDIYLCGVDLYDRTHFYKKEEPSGFEGELRKKNIDFKIHSTAVEFDGIRGVLDVLEWINSKIRLYTTNKKSLLNSVLEYRQIC